jgi:hypothetical protein
MVASVDLDLQQYPPRLSGLKEKIVQVNSYVLTNSIYLAKSDRKLVGAYLRALGELTTWVQREGNNDKIMTILPRKTRPVAKVSEKLNKRVQKVLEQT